MDSTAAGLRGRRGPEGTRGPVGAHLRGQCVEEEVDVFEEGIVNTVLSAAGTSTEITPVITTHAYII